jgi:pimeloyl-ACP methyl ester carboxylesterase
MSLAGRFRFIDVAAAGDRPRGTLLLLHAFPLNARMWEPQLGLAAQGWRIVAPHYRGFDGGAADPPASSVDDYAGDIIDLLDSLHVTDAVVAGLSIGGYVAFALLRRAPRYVRGLVLADTRSQADTPEGVESRKKMLALVAEAGSGAPAAIVEDMLPKLLGAGTRAHQPDVAARVRELALANPPGAIEGAIRALMTRPDSTPLLETIRCPTLIVVGDEDVLTPPKFSEDMHAAIPGSELKIIPAAGHLSSLEQPAAFNSALSAFLTHRI